RASAADVDGRRLLRAGRRVHAGLRGGPPQLHGSRRRRGALRRGFLGWLDPALPDVLAGDRAPDCARDRPQPIGGADDARRSSGGTHRLARELSGPPGWAALGGELRTLDHTVDTVSAAAHRGRVDGQRQLVWSGGGGLGHDRWRTLLTQPG